MALMIIRGNMPLLQMIPFIGLNGAIVGGLFYLGIDAISNFSDAKAGPKYVLVRNGEGRVLSIETKGGSQEETFSLFGDKEEEEAEVIKLPLLERLGITHKQVTDTIRTGLIVALLLETYMGAAYVSNNWTPLMVITTGSMEPILQVGDLIYVKGVEPSEIQVGDVITFRPPLEFISGTLVTHRVVGITYDVNEVFFKTKGDNNPSVDPWTIESRDVIGRQEAVFKGIGNYFLWVKTPAGLTTMLALVSLYMFLPNIREALGGMRRK